MREKKAMGARECAMGALSVALAACVVAGVTWLFSMALGLGFDLPWALAAGAALVCLSTLGGD